MFNLLIPYTLTHQNRKSGASTAKRRKKVSNPRLLFLRPFLIARPLERIENRLDLSEILPLVILRSIHEAVENDDILSVTAIEGM